MAEIFGFSINRSKAEKEELKKTSFVAPDDDEGAQYIASAGNHYGQYIDVDGDKAKDTKELILKYRAAAQITECDAAIEDIINEALVADSLQGPIAISLDDLEVSKGIANKIRDEFDTIIKLTKVNTSGHDLFRKWYVDGRLYHHIMVDEKSAARGILEVRYIDPTRIRKVKELIKEKDPKTGTEVIKGVKEYYLYQTNNMMNKEEALRITPDAISYVTSGLMDPERKKVISHIHKALKPANQLRLLEDSVVIYRVSRAPERRIFYIDVGNLPKSKAEAYLQGIMNKYRNKMVYDASTGDIKDGKTHMSALEDFWLPRREGGRGTEISSLPGGTNLGEIEDIMYFQKKLYKSLNVPVQRLESESSFSMGRSTEITRDEVKFSKFIARLRLKFSDLFMSLLRTQLLLKKIISAEDWEEYKDEIKIIFESNVHFAELKAAEVLRERVDTLTNMEMHIGTYYSREWVRKNVLMQTEEEIKELDKQIEDEKESGEIDDDVLDADGDGDFDVDDVKEVEDQKPLEVSKPKPKDDKAES